MNLAVAITLVILIAFAGVSVTYNLHLYKMLKKIHKKLSDKVFYWLIKEE